MDNITISDVGGSCTVTSAAGNDDVTIENVGGACAISCAGGNIIDVRNGELMLGALALYFC